MCVKVVQLILLRLTLTHFFWRPVLEIEMSHQMSPMVRCKLACSMTRYYITEAIVGV